MDLPCAPDAATTDTPTLRVILNDRVLRPPLTGVGHYAAALLQHLGAHPSVRIEPYSRRRGAAPPRSAGRAATPLRRWPWWVRRVAERVYAAGLRRRAAGYDLYHEPNHIPIACDRPTVTTIHDLSGILHPQWHPRDRARWYESEFAAGLRRTTRFIAASQFTRRELADRFGVAQERVDVTYQAARPAFTVPSAESVRAARRALDLPQQFLLYAGTLEPRKNVAGLLDAYDALPRSLRARCPLVLAGAAGWGLGELRRRIEARVASGEVRALGYQDDAALATLYGGCTALVWPTLYEGFGLPPLEAMACGAAVIASRVSSLPEVVGDAGVLLDPHDVSAWTAAMQRAVEDDGWRDAASRRGLAQAARFTWAGFARATAACYRAALRG